MADNIDKEHLDNPINHQSENPPDEINPTIYTATINQNQKNEYMDADKHPYYETHKKKWGEYFLEFLMLFLAVFLGFLAENLREHNGENERAKEYAISLIQDLQNDTIAINNQNKSAGIYISISDRLFELGKIQLLGRPAAEFLFYTRFLYWTVPVSWNRATFEQIKNSGSLRYFKNYQLLQKLMKYNGLVNEIQSEFNNHQTRGNMLLNQINEIIDPEVHNILSKYMLSDLDTMSKKTLEDFFSMKTGHLENKRKEISELLNMTIVQQRNLLFNKRRLLQTKELANELISDLKNEFKID